MCLLWTVVNMVFFLTRFIIIMYNVLWELIESVASEQVEVVINENEISQDKQKLYN